MNIIRKIKFKKVPRIWIALILLLITLTILQPKFFLKWENLSNVARQIAVNSLLAAGQLFVILSGGIDLSNGAILGLSMIVCALIDHGDFPFIFVLLVPILVGFVCGYINGIGFIKLKLPHPFIMTLATLNIFRGITYLITGAIPISGLSKNIRWLGSANIGLTIFNKSFEVPVSFLFVLFLYFILSFLLKKLKFGPHLYATGGNIVGAKYAGINLNRILITVYTISGVMAGIGGLLLAGRTNSGYPNAGIGMELDSIAAVIIGGASFFGGRGSIAETFAGVLLIGFLKNGLNLMNVSVFWQQIFIGVVIIIAIVSDGFRQNVKKILKLK